MARMPEALQQLHAQFLRYASLWPGEASTVAQFQRLLQAGSQAFRREHVYGHFTGSAWLSSNDGRRVLLTHHRKLGRWLQLGGHADGDMDLARVALREAEEESGLRGLRGDAEIFDLDRHWIPERGAEPGHWHYDVRYCVSAGVDEAFSVSAESHALAWRDIRDLTLAGDLDRSLQRMAQKWLRERA